MKAIARSSVGRRGDPCSSGLLLVSVLHAAVLAPLTPLADALALGSASAKPGFRYGWVCGAGSAALIVATLASGQLVGRAGLGIIVWLDAGLLAIAAMLSHSWTLPTWSSTCHFSQPHAGVQAVQVGFGQI